MKKSACIAIGNSDNKLTQQEWANYVQRVRSIVDTFALVTHFFGGSSTWERWQNVCWLIDIDDSDLAALKQILKQAREYYRQDSVAIVVGETEFV